MWRPSQFTTVVVFVITVVVIPLSVNIAGTAVPKPVEPYLWLAWPLSVVAAILAAVVESRRRAASGAAEGADQPQRDPRACAADQLARTLFSQWSAEAEMRMLHRPHPLRLRWSATSRPVVPRPGAADSATRSGDGASGELSGSGGGLPGDGHDELLRNFLGLRSRRLVLLGDPGAGKTVLAILLTLGLLEHRRDHGGPVPVLLSLSSWDPRTEHLHTWVVRRLVEDYPALANTDVFGADAARGLVTDGSVLPVLDGLDEMPALLHGAALEALDRIAPAHPMVVTCRSIEYETAVETGGTVLTTAAVVELEPVGAHDVIAFLDAGGVTIGERWTPVLAHLRQQPHGPLAGALSSPLMTSLLRTVYRDPSADPGELLDPERFPDRAAVEGHLLDAFLPAAYQHLPAPPSAAPESDRTATGRPHYPPEHAHHWLAFLAAHLQRNRTRDLVLWHLHHGLPQGGHKAVGVVLEVATGCVAGLGVAAGAGWDVGMTAGLAGGFGAGLMAAPPAHPGCVNLEIRGRLRPIVRKFAVGQALGLVTGFGALIAAALAASLGFGLVGGVAGMAKVSFAVGLGAGLAFGAMMCLNTPADAIRSPTPWSVMRDDRTVSAIRAVVETLGSGVLAGVLLGRGEFGLTVGIEAAALFGLGSGLAVGLAGRFTSRFQTGLAASAWAWYAASRCWLALRGRIPWRLTRFLADAHRRGVLRQTGAVYQFRHARLQDRLAEPAAGRTRE
ncbi:NACHT domain-containing protein [Streptomyces sp. NPDC059788]|uniref:NACHT domain-containing protein n=1 Tax=Streptomyces sp. NPDC059788 TaxID=3346948 RepID=UPI00366034A0